MSGTLALSAALAAMDRDALRALVRRRKPQSLATVSDPIGLASELLRTDSIERAIAPLDRTYLAALLAPMEAPQSVRERLLALGLLGLDEGSAVALDEVGEVLHASLERVSASQSFDAQHLLPARGTDTSSWYVPAITAAGAAAEIVRAVRTHPARMNRSGTVAVAAVKTFSLTTRITPEDITHALHGLTAARLLTPSPDKASLSWSSETAAWLDAPIAERWVALASATVSSMPEPLRALVAHTDLDAAFEALPEHYPLLPPTMFEASARFVDVAAYLGLTVQGSLTPAARTLLESDADAAVGDATRAALDIARADMPAAVTGVYVQPDLSVVIPGPLAPADEAVLVTLTLPEQVGIASTRRITEASITAAFEHGISVEAAHATFARLSVTGIPQPLEYMLSSLGERVRSILVSEVTGDTTRTRVDVARADLRDTLLVDRALHHVQLTPGSDSTVLYSRLRADHVFAALGDARYTATLASAQPRTIVHPAPPAPDTELPEELAKLVDRVHSAAHSEAGAGGFTRRLELAIRDRSTVQVTASAQGHTHVFTLLPTSLSAGRLRATDPRAGVERTLPVNTITAVE